ncbi:MAG: flagellar motor protein MotB [Thermoleophilia bacterium]|nr:flagellar motor protein MotB [Thermoleophilia bacterium]
MSSRRNRGGGGHGDGGHERWLLPYSDMITLLLGLFIVLFAMSSIDAKQFDNVKRSLSQTFNGAVLEESGGVMPGSSGALDPNASTAAPTPSAVQIQEAVRQSAARFEKQEQQLKALVKESGLGNDVQVTTNEKGIKINLAGDALFMSGSWEIKPEFRAKLVRIERQLAAFNHPIEIAGHTDGQPFPGGNRLLGWNRASAVYQLFVEQGYDGSRIETVSWGDDKPLTKPQNKTTPNKRNRRIEITVLQPAADSSFTETERVAKLATQAQGITPESIEKLRPVAPEEEFDTALVEELAATAKADG